MHPFAQQRLSATDAVVFRSPSQGALLSLVADHVIQGTILFPGVAYLEMGRAAHCGRSRGDAANLSGVYFVQPLAAETAGLYVDITGAVESIITNW